MKTFVTVNGKHAQFMHNLNQQIFLMIWTIINFQDIMENGKKRRTNFQVFYVKTANADKTANTLLLLHQLS